MPGYIDPDMELAVKNAIQTFKTQYYNGKKFYDEYKYSGAGLRCFGNSVLKDISLGTLLSLCSNILNKDANYINKIILGLSLNGDLCSAITDIVLAVPNRFQHNVQPDLISNIINSPTYPAVAAEPKPLSDRAQNILFYTPNVTVKDPIFKKAVANYLIDYVNDISLSFNSRIFHMYHIQNLVNQIFTEVSCEDLNIDLISNLTSALSNSDCNYIKNILYYISRNLSIDDELTRALAQIHAIWGEQAFPYRSSTFKFSSLLRNKYLCRTFYAYHSYYILEIDDDDIFYMMKDFVQNGYSKHPRSLTDMIDNFDKSLKYSGINTISDISFDTFCRQIEYYQTHYPKNNTNRKNESAVVYLCYFYAYTLNHFDGNLFKDAALAQAVTGKGFPEYIYRGYTLLHYNLADDIPEPDKWLLCFNRDSEPNVCTSNYYAMDFTPIHNSTYRDWAKYYIWKSNISLRTKYQNTLILSTFFNYVDDLKSGKQLSIYTKPTTDITISGAEAAAYKIYISSRYTNNTTPSIYISTIHTMLTFLRANTVADISDSVLYILKASSSHHKNASAIKNIDLKRLTEQVNLSAQQSNIYALYKIIFALALETEFRSSQILALSIDCVKRTFKQNEYVIVSKTKTSNNEIIEIPITRYTKRHIEAAKELTQVYRDDCKIEELKQKIFIVPYIRDYRYSTIESWQVNRWLADCCRKANIKKYTLANLRDTHMTKSEEYIIREKLSDMQQNILSGHKSPNTDIQHYVDMDIRQMLESVHGIIIGDVDIQGHITHELSPDIANKQNLVSHQCGYCNSKNCTDLSYLDCLMCKHFVTTPSRLHYFEERIKVLDKQIQQADIPHDKEDLTAIKRIILRYEEVIINLKKEGDN